MWCLFVCVRACVRVCGVWMFVRVRACVFVCMWMGLCACESEQTRSYFSGNCVCLCDTHIRITQLHKLPSEFDVSQILCKSFNKCGCSNTHWIRYTCCIFIHIFLNRTYQCKLCCRLWDNSLADIHIQRIRLLKRTHVNSWAPYNLPLELHYLQHAGNINKQQHRSVEHWNKCTNKDNYLKHITTDVILIFSVATIRTGFRRKP